MNAKCKLKTLLAICGAMLCLYVISYFVFVEPFLYEDAIFCTDDMDIAWEGPTVVYDAGTIDQIVISDTRINRILMSAYWPAIRIKSFFIEERVKLRDERMTLFDEP